ncbi:MAG: hypothetical protein ASARMPREDX12_006713 [Alectoria sarmentosa]|nr:MAG: hypothetical protein ASARMPREDX12_006713 [Alectoria sarmentosa]
MTDKRDFEGYKWNGKSSHIEDSPYGQCIQRLLDRINWDALCQYASRLHDDEDCTISPQFTMGGRHMVRRVIFQSGTRWIARVRITTTMNEDEGSRLLQREVDCIQLVQERTSVPVPTIFGYIASARNVIGAPFMLMECLSGNVGVDLSGVEIPAQHKASFHREMARFQTEISSITFPKIGAIVKLQDGTYDVGPLPGLGGPFITATEYFEAWARSAKFVETLDRVKQIWGDGYEEIIAQIVNFPPRVGELASKIAARDQGPFPLFHVDFGHNNIVVDDDYNVLGVIDWEHASSVPWERIYFPWTLSVVPAPMVPDNYDENGVPRDSGTKAIISEQEGYINTVRETERDKGLSPLLSATLADQASQDLAYAMKLYTEDGICGQYTNVLDVHQERWVEDKGLSISDGAGNSEDFKGGAH